MQEGVSISRIRARKSRIRQRLDRDHGGHQPRKLTRGAKLGMAAWLMFLLLLGIVAFQQSASSAISEPHPTLPQR